MLMLPKLLPMCLCDGLLDGLCGDKPPNVYLMPALAEAASLANSLALLEHGSCLRGSEHRM